MAGKAKNKSKTVSKRRKAATLDPEKVAELTDYRSQGYSVLDIAAEQKMDPQDVVAHIEAGLAADFEEPPLFHVRLEIKRLNDLQRSMMQQAAAGDVEATKQVLVLEEKIARAKMQLFPDIRELFGDVSLWRRANIDPAKGGRPPHRPTQASIRRVEGMALVQTPVATMARIMDISINTLKEHYGFAIETARARLLAAAGTAVADNVYKGDVRAGMHVLDRLGPKDWKPPPPPTFDKGKTDPAGSMDKHEIVVHGGLPQGSTAENPGGDAQAALEDTAKGAAAPPGDGDGQ